MKFRQFAPKWYKAMQLYKKGERREYEKFLSRNRLNIADASRCIIGEAFGFKAKYNFEYEKYPSKKSKDYCPICHDTGYRLYDKFDDSGAGHIDIKGLEETIREYEEHFCEAHAK